MSNTNEKADTAYFIIKDTTLPDTMKFDFSSVKVSGINKDNYTIEQSGNGWVLRSKRRLCTSIRNNDHSRIRCRSINSW